MTTLPPLRCLLLVAAVAGLAAEAGGGLFQPRISHRDLALNQAVRVTFNTLLPQVADIDPEQVVISALELPSVRASWRVFQAPAVVPDEKVRTMSVAYSLLPRQAGELDLPVIPLRWLEGEQYADMGAVTVAGELAHGGDRLPLPIEIERVAGFRWGTNYDDLLTQAGVEAGVRDEARDAMLIVPSQQPNLTLVVRGGFLTSAVLQAPGLPLADAGEAFRDRWGEHLLHDRALGRLQWIIGWVRITASAVEGGTRLEIVNERFENQLRRSQVREQVFSILDQKPPEAPSEAESTPAAERARDYEREFERAGASTNP